jgi:dipeptidyl aminopeptidase/acylaminoacyl peptidase
MLPVFALVASALLGPLAPPAQTPDVAERPRDRLTIEDWFAWETVADPRPSPDGRSIVYTRTWFDAIADRSRTELWLMDADGARQRFLAVGSDPVWSPEGRRIAYLAEGLPKGPQVFVVWVDTRETSQITRVVEAPADLQWSNDGRFIAHTMQVPEKDGFPIEMPKAPKGATWVEDARVITRLVYRRDASGWRPSGWRHIFVVSADGGSSRQISSGDYDHGRPQWTPDDREIVCDGKRFEDADWQPRESDIYAIDVATGAVRTLSDRPGSDTQPVVLGDIVVFVGDDHTGATYEPARVWKVPLADGDPTCLSADFDRSVQQLRRVGPGVNDAFLFTFEDEGGVRAGRMTLDGVLTTLSPVDAWFRAAGELYDGSLVGQWIDAHEPSTIARVRDGRPTKLTAVHDDVLFGKKLGAVEELRWTSTDGLAVQGWLVKPPDFDATKKYPLVLQIHGGPHAMYGINFDFERQLLAANGHIVLYTNPRGSTGYGSAFANGIQNAYPGLDYDDLMTGVDAAIARGSVDERNLFVFGGSGGGVLTCWIVGSTKRFRAAAALFPVTNWISFVGTTDGVTWYDNFADRPWQSIEEHWRRSPLRLVGNVETPTMLLTGELDLRTPMSQTEEYYQALKLRKVDTVLVRIQNEYHGVGARHPSNRIRRMLYVHTWFDKHRVRDEAAEASDAAR